MAAMVVVGAGEAGARAAATLRALGWAGDLVLIGTETHPPYERPPLSKAVLAAPEPPEPVTILSPARLQELDIAFLSGRTVVAIDRAARQVACDDGRSVAYGRLLLATGARPRRLAIEGADHALYLRSFADALAVRGRLRPEARVVIVGGGFIGLELAASAASRGCRVTLVESASRVLGRGVPPEIAATVADLHRAAGVALRLGTEVAAFGVEAGRHVVALADGSELPCDGIVVGVGAVPETDLAAASGLAIENGVAADDRLRSSDPAIFAAGDCCSYPAALFGGRRLRLEAWRNAQSQGAHAAAGMLGADAAYDDIPWFWSDQYDQTLQVAGLPSCGVTTIRRDGDGMVAFFHLDETGRLVAASGIGRPALGREIRLAEKLIASRAAPDPAALASPAVRLRSLLSA